MQLKVLMSGFQRIEVVNSKQNKRHKRNRFRIAYFKKKL